MESLLLCINNQREVNYKRTNQPMSYEVIYPYLIKCGDT